MNIKDEINNAMESVKVEEELKEKIINKCTENDVSLVNISIKKLVTVAMMLTLIGAITVMASADLREALFGIFTATKTDEVGPGLERDSYTIFDGTLLDGQSAWLHDGIITITGPEKMEYGWYVVDSRYEYKDGMIVKIATNESVDVVVNYEGAEYRVYFEYFIRNNGELVVYDNLGKTSETYTCVGPVRGRTDMVLIDLGDLIENYIRSKVLFDLTTLEFIDDLLPKEIMSAQFSPDGSKALSLFRSDISGYSYSMDPNGNYELESNPDTETTLYLTDFDTGETVELPNKYQSYYGWIDNDSFLYHVPEKLDCARYNTVTGEDIMLTEGAILQSDDGDGYFRAFDYANDYFSVGVGFGGPAGGSYGRLCPNTGELIVAKDLPRLFSKTSPNGQWVAYIKDSESNQLYLYNLDSHKKFNFSEKFLDGLDGRPMLSYCWFDDQVLAVVVEGGDYATPGDAINMGMNTYLYTFRIDDRFLAN